jgi:hypothetical protein
MDYSLQHLWNLYRKELEDKELKALEYMDSEVEDIPIIKVSRPINSILSKKP